MSAISASFALAGYALTINLPGDMFNPQPKKSKPQTSMAADLYQFRANHVVESLNGILADYQRELQDTKEENAEMSRMIKAEGEAKLALAEQGLAATEERKKSVELAAKFVSCATKIEGKGEV